MSINVSLYQGLNLGLSDPEPDGIPMCHSASLRIILLFAESGENMGKTVKKIFLTSKQFTGQNPNRLLAFISFTLALKKLVQSKNLFKVGLVLFCIDKKCIGQHQMSLGNFLS